MKDEEPAAPVFVAAEAGSEEGEDEAGARVEDANGKAAVLPMDTSIIRNDAEPDGTVSCCCCCCCCCDDEEEAAAMAVSGGATKREKQRPSSSRAVPDVAVPEPASRRTCLCSSSIFWYSVMFCCSSVSTLFFRPTLTVVSSFSLKTTSEKREG